MVMIDRRTCRRAASWTAAAAGLGAPPRRLVVTALGGGVPTPASGITAEPLPSPSPSPSSAAR